MKKLIMEIIDNIYFRLKSKQGEGLELFDVEHYELLRANLSAAVELLARLDGWKKDELDLPCFLLRENDDSVLVSEKYFIRFLKEYIDIAKSEMKLYGKGKNGKRNN